jgi:transmembrane sensor
MTVTDPQGEGDVHAQAAMWFAKLRTLPVSRTTLEAFFAWKREPAHADAFDAVHRFWDKAGVVADEPAILAATQEAIHRRRQGRAGWRKVSALPAALAVLLAAGGVGYLALGRGGNTYVTSVGEQSAVRLEDGSQVRLDTDTRLRVAFADGERRVTLDHGQASFAVAHDPAHPFTVDAGGVRVTAIGTRFDVRRDGGTTSVTLVEGRIRIDPVAGNPRFLVAGEQWSDSGDAAASVRPANVADATAWESGRIILDGRSLAAAIAEVNRYAAHPVHLDAPRYAQARLSGSVMTGDTTSFVAATTAMLPLRATTDANGSVTLSERRDRL